MFYDQKQRYLCIQTILGLMDAAHWWDPETGPTKAAEVNLRDSGDGLNTSARSIFRFALQLYHESYADSLWRLLGPLDLANRKVISELVNAACASNSSNAVEEWLSKYAPLRLRNGRRM